MTSSDNGSSWTDYEPLDGDFVGYPCAVAVAGKWEFLPGKSCSQLRQHGGRGYDYIWTDFLPLLRGEGVSQQSIDNILVENPSRALDIP